MKNKAKLALSLLSIQCLSGIGDVLYRIGVTVLLLSKDYSAWEVSTIIAATALPNVTLAPVLGRWVDRSNKKRLFLTLSCLLCSIHFLTLFALGWFSNVEIKPLVPVLLVLFACLYFPYQTIFYQYIVPSLGKNEQHAYSRWEQIFSLSSVIGGLAGFFLLTFLKSAAWLLVFDSITFLLSGIVVFRVWNWEVVPKSDREQKVWRFSAIKKIFSSHGILLGAVGMWTFAFLIDSFMGNVMVISRRQFEIPYAYLGLFEVLFSVISFFGSYLYIRLNAAWKNNYIQFQRFLLLSCIPFLIAVYLGIALDRPVLCLLMLIWVGLIDPMWSTNNTLLLRENIAPNRYGEFFGFIRMPRAVFTLIGMSCVGLAQDLDFLGQSAILAAILLGGVILFSYRFHMQRRKL